METTRIFSRSDSNGMDVKTVILCFVCCFDLESFFYIRAINFAAYGNGKKFFSELNHGNETAIVHLAAAANAGNVLC